MLRNTSVFLLLVALCAAMASAQWTSNPAVNTAVASGAYNARNPFVVASAPGEVFVLYDRGYGGRITARKFDALGYGSTPIPLADTSGEQMEVTALPDGHGGFYAVWVDQRAGNWDIFAQRISSAGARLWGTYGIPLCRVLGAQRKPLMVGMDSSFVVLWEDSRAGDRDIYGQRVLLPNGTISWVPDGLPLVTAGGDQSAVTAVRVGDEILFAWVDGRSTGAGVYAQKVSMGGVIGWDHNGVLVARDMAPETPNIALADSDSAFYVTWSGFGGSYGSQNVFIRKMSFAGDTLWMERIGLSGTQKRPHAIVNGSEFALIFEDNRRGNWDLFLKAFRDTDSGRVTVRERYVTEVPGDQYMAAFADAESSVFVVWQDYRFGGWDIYAQAIGKNDWLNRWTTGGNAVSVASGNQTIPAFSLVPATVPWGVAVFEDTRNNGWTNVYAQRLNLDGSLGILTSLPLETPVLSDSRLLQNYPNPFNLSTRIDFTIPQSGWITLKVYDVLGQEVRTFVDEVLPPGVHHATWDARDFPSGIYFCRFTAANPCGEFTAEVRKMVLLK